MTNNERTRNSTVLAVCCVLGSTGLAVASPARLLHVIEQPELPAELKENIVDAYFAGYLAGAELEWRTLLVQQALRLQERLHDAPGVPNEDGLRAELTSDEVEWRVAAHGALTRRNEQAARLRRLLPSEAEALLRGGAFPLLPYARDKIEKIAYASIVARAERELNDSEQQLTNAKPKPAIAHLGWSAVGLSLPDRAVARSDYVLAMRRHERAIREARQARATAGRDVAQLLNQREHIEADLLVAQSSVANTMRRAAEQNECEVEDTCVFAEAMAGYREAVALKRFWLGLHVDAAKLEAQVWRMAAQAASTQSRRKVPGIADAPTPGP